MLAGFTTQRVYHDQNTGEFVFCVQNHYVWDCINEVYLNTDDDNDFYFEIPKNGKLIYKYSDGLVCRLLVRKDKRLWKTN